MMELHIDLEQFPNEAARQFVINGVDNYNIAITGEAVYYPGNFFLKDPRGEVLGGILGQIWGKWLHVTYLWVAEPVRAAGDGRALMARAEQYAIEREPPPRAPDHKVPFAISKFAIPVARRS